MPWRERHFTQFKAVAEALKTAMRWAQEAADTAEFPARVECVYCGSEHVSYTQDTPEDRAKYDPKDYNGWYADIGPDGCARRLNGWEIKANVQRQHKDHARLVARWYALMPGSVERVIGEEDGAHGPCGSFTQLVWRPKER